MKEIEMHRKKEIRIYKKKKNRVRVKRAKGSKKRESGWEIKIVIIRCEKSENKTEREREFNRNVDREIELMRE